jgi:outer membrane biosynthesis protein TonB/Tfp pilus assembly protein PilF
MHGFKFILKGGILLLVFVLAAVIGSAQTVQGKVEVTCTVQPELTQGNVTFLNYLNRKISYPVKAKENCIVGKLEVSFTINAEGKADSITLDGKLGLGCEDEVLNALNTMTNSFKQSDQKFNFSVDFSQPEHAGCNTPEGKAKAEYALKQDRLIKVYEAGVKYMNANQHQKALQSFAYCLKNKVPYAKDVNYNMGIVFLNMGDKEKAKGYLTAAYEMGDLEAKKVIAQHIDKRFETYVNSKGDRVPKQNATYFRISKWVDSTNMWSVNDYYLNGVLQSEGWSKKSDPVLYTGKATFYLKYERIGGDVGPNILESIEEYKDVRHKEISGTFINGSMHGRWQYHVVEQYYNSALYFKNNKGIKNGTWIVDTEILDSVTFEPEFSFNTASHLNNLKRDNNGYYQELMSRGGDGRVYLEFWLTETGEIVDVEVIDGTEPYINEVALNFVSGHPKVEPVKLNGVPTKVKMGRLFTFEPKNDKAFTFLNVAAGNIKNKEVDKALEMLGKSLEAKPDYLQALHTRGQLLMFNGKEKEGVADLKRAANLGYEPSEYLLLKTHYKVKSDGSRGGFETAPSFPGQLPELRKHMKKHVKYPTYNAEQIRQQMGYVTVSFTVSETGRISDVKPAIEENDITDPAYTAAAVSYMENMIDWLPATRNGIKVKVTNQKLAIYFAPHTAEKNYIFYRNQGIELYKAGEFSRAANMFTESLSRKADKITYFYKGKLRFDQGKAKEACKDWKKALEMGYSEASELLGANCKE